MGKLLLASGNRGKLLEFQDLLQDLSAEILLPSEIGIELDVKEDGVTYTENAARKALAYAKQAGIHTLADDSGLEVDALEGAPGLYSARFSPLPHATDADRRAVLLSRLQSKPRPWQAHFHCTVALATPSGEVLFTQGDCPGEIIPEERGQNGFGYDPVFFISSLGKTMAELTMEEKNRLSHRAIAVKAAVPLLSELLKKMQ